MNEVFETMGKKFPFLSLIRKGDLEFVGIISNQDSQVTSFYDYGRIMLPEDKMKYLKLGETWWWESNRMLPIDVFLFHEMQDFKHCVRTFVLKETEVLFGPVTSMQNILKKRIKRRSIQLVKKTKD